MGVNTTKVSNWGYVALVDKDGNVSGVGTSGGGTDSSPTSIQSAPLGAGTDRSGAITTGGTAQQLAAANTARRALYGQNISAEDMWINEIGGTAAATTSGSYRVTAGQNFSISTNRAVSIVAATTGSKFTATEI